VTNKELDVKGELGLLPSISSSFVVISSIDDPFFPTWHRSNSPTTFTNPTHLWWGPGCTLSLVFSSSLGPRLLLTSAVGITRYTASCFPSAIDMLSRGVVDLKQLITIKFRLTKSAEAFEAVASGKQIKVIVKNQEE
jgi:hypothetical protein